MMELDFVTSFVNFAAAALTFGAVAMPLFKKTFGLHQTSNLVQTTGAENG